MREASTAPSVTPFASRPETMATGAGQVPRLEKTSDRLGKLPNQNTGRADREGI